MTAKSSQNLVESNKLLMENNKKLTEQLENSITNIQPSRSFKSQSQRKIYPPDPLGYCWTHGYRMRVGHTSAACSNKAEHHNDDATRADIMGGSVRNKGWDTST